ncbi:hypothetical protein DBR32_13060 [Taibaiella sp. KBW10]|uniref:T9SS type A sorting domain-containing protein n=1 Tax=Taibaiella sp. KBW10 TaxID=2153357 RepID=UPI000F5AE21D|nr:T9SS type A sorting domain-containing protein [Taibaiella sp. KBW10]RQO30489.1 hypothetical protein DBR32_13060 [Taibaiella sp. KBW10]
MKKIFTTLALIGAFMTVANAQQKTMDLGVKFLLPVTARTYNNLANGDTLLVAIEVSNNGPDALATTDTLTSYMDIGFLGLTQSLTRLVCPQVNIASGQKDTFVFSFVKSATVPIPNDAKICTWVSIFGFDEDRTVFADAGFNLAAFNAATTAAAVKAAFSGNNINAANNIIIGSGATDKCGTTSLVDVIKGHQFKEALVVYPNPTKSDVNFDYTFTKNTTATVKVLDVTGRVVFTQAYGKQAIGKKSFKIDMSSLSNGMYSIELITDDARAISKFSVAK